MTLIPNAQNNEPYELLIDTTEGGFFNRQRRNANRFDWQESYQFAPRQFLGTHKFKVGLDYAHSDFNGTEIFVPAELIGTSGTAIERVTFSRPSFLQRQPERNSAVCRRPVVAYQPADIHPRDAARQR